MPSAKRASATVLVLLMILATSRPLFGGKKEEDKSFERLNFESVKQDELTQIKGLLRSPAWQRRTFGLMRLDRFNSSPNLAALVKPMLADTDWHVQAMAMWTLRRMGSKVEALSLKQEADPRLVRFALRLGFTLDVQYIQAIARKPLTSRDVEVQLLGIEILLASPDHEQRARGVTYAQSYAAKLNPNAVFAVRDRLNHLAPFAAQTRSHTRSRAALASWSKKLKASKPAGLFSEKEVRDHSIPWIARIDADKFVQAVDYIQSLEDKTFEFVLMIDATGSMGAEIRSVQSSVHRLIHTLSDLTEGVRVSIVGYRDRGDQKPVEAIRLTADINRLRNFLAHLKATGGGDAPEGVVLGFQTAWKVGWYQKPSVLKHVVVIGDAPAHEEDMKAIEVIVKRLVSYRKAQVHAMPASPGKTVEQFRKFSKWGNGQCMPMVRRGKSDVARNVLVAAVDPRFAQAFDDFYSLYVKLAF